MKLCSVEEERHSITVYIHYSAHWFVDTLDRRTGQMFLLTSVLAFYYPLSVELNRISTAVTSVQENLQVLQGQKHQSTVHHQRALVELVLDIRLVCKQIRMVLHDNRMLYIKQTELPLCCISAVSSCLYDCYTECLQDFVIFCM